ncbi:MAG: coproporphyrinogen III oxidase [Caulobacteraceae bacterium]|nr:coproporphyrinogen III oxidase [Caulobacteraceae bacterium]
MSAAPLAVYVHWPYCARICPYCDFNVVRDRSQAEQAGLAEAILADLAAQAALIGPRRLVSVFFGGGTPSLMAPEQVARIIEAARALWPPNEAADGAIEVTLEANPTDAEAGRFSSFAAAGVTRLSLGVQALDDQALQALGRNHDAAEARRAAELARRCFPKLSLDLIYALPGQTPPAWAAAIEAALAFSPDHLSPYQLTIEPGTAFDRAVRRGTLTPPSGDQAATLYETTQDVLAAHGFEAYEVSNHARGREARSRHNLAYWRGEDYLGAGPGAHGRLAIAGARTATLAAAKPRDYIAAVRNAGVGFVEREALSPREAALERLLMGLRLSDGVAWPELSPLNLSAESPAARDLAGHGLVELGAARLSATARGRAVLDRVVEALADG